MAGHVHAALMAEYAEVAKTNDKPWKEFEVSGVFPQKWTDLISTPTWNESSKYRRKTRTININGFEVPEPMRVAPAYGEIYFSIAIRNTSKMAAEYIWRGDSTDLNDLRLGLAHKTHEAAELHAKALLSFTTSVRE